MESIFLILSGVILMAGVLYWLWSHIQLTQKKVQLLENAVFELRGMLGSGSGPGPGIPAGPPASPTKTVVIEEPSAAAVAASTSTSASEEEEDWKSTPLDALEEMPTLSVTETDDLQPGGRAIAGGSLDIDFSDPPAFAPAPAPTASETTDTTESFRNLFVKQESAPASTPASSTSSKGSESLDNMPLKELRRLGEQRGIAGAADMRKKDLLAALRQQVAAPTLVASSLDDTVKEVNIETVASAGLVETVDVSTESAEILE